MTINTESLKSFLQVIELGSFTKAAAKLGLTQSALSQKIARLEADLGATVIIRGSDALSLTAAGEKLLIYSRQQIQLEAEFLEQFEGSDKLSGVLRIAGFSSIMRSLVIPKLAPWIREHKNLTIEFSSHEVHELAEILRSNRADFIITDFHPDLPGTEQLKIGEEEYVVIESRHQKNIPEIYLDHYPRDNATEAYFTFQGSPPPTRRSYMGDVYGILDGVDLGLGKAVMSRHLVDKRFKIVKKNFKKYSRPIVLSYYRQSFYPSAHKRVLEILARL